MKTLFKKIYNYVLIAFTAISLFFSAVCCVLGIYVIESKLSMCIGIIGARTAIVFVLLGMIALCFHWANKPVLEIKPTK